MQIRNNFNLEIKPYEWLYIIAAAVIIILVIRGDIQSAVGLLKDLIPKPK
ncbi:MAG: hypothetical protein ABI237_18200 [Ginsengibacter sp.]